MPQVQARDHGRYVIKGGFINNKAVARAFVRNASRIKGSVIECTGDSVEAAIERVATELDRMAVDAASFRRMDQASGIAVPTQSEFETALRGMSISERVLNLLHVQAIAPGWLPTLRHIAKVCGFEELSEVERAYDRIAGAIAADLGLRLATGSRVRLLLDLPQGQPLTFDIAVPLHPELRSALIALLGTASPLLDWGQLVGNL
jgi:hypothetical protein